MLSKRLLRRFFDRRWYVSQYGRRWAARQFPLTYHRYRGWKKQYSPHPLFDPAWYLDENPDVASAGIDPFTHFIEYGWREGREPTWRFSLKSYLASLTQPLNADVIPFEHFLLNEYAPVAHDPAAIATLLARFRRNDEFLAAGCSPADAVRNPGDVRAIAIYLPQFHRVPENDQWWGEGFTEWTNVRRGRPMYPGHDQPRVPHDDIGYYDLDDPAVIERQAALAREYGIYGFCFYYYWFDGRRILEKPLDRMLRSSKPDIPFCLCWANENWTRTWDGRDREVLLEQRHSPEGDERFLRDLLPALKDPRYIRIDDRPLLAVYRPALLSDPEATASRWRSIAKQEGLPGLHLAAFQSFDRADPLGFGFDSAIQFPPLQTRSGDLAAAPNFAAEPGFRGRVHDYRDAMRHFSGQPRQCYPLFRSVMPRWDNTARRMERATSWINATPERYGDWLRSAVAQTQIEHPDGRQFLFINAWNEWAEGAHLEPDTKHGYRYLEETHAALQTAQGGVAGGPIDMTTARHPDVVRQRSARLESIVGRPLSGRARDVLKMHVPLVAQLSAAGYSISIADGIPCCEINGTSFFLEGPEGLACAHDAAFGDGSNRPFAFVLLQFGTPQVTARCVESIRRLDAAGRDVQIVIVDNSSPPEAIEETRRLFSGMPGVTLIWNPENIGFARGNNVGYRHARERLGADFIAVVNNDTVIEDRGFIPKCISIFGRHAYSVLGPDIVTPDGRHDNPWNDFVYSPDEWRKLHTVFENQRDTWRSTDRAKFRRIGTRSPEARNILNPVLQGAAYVFSPIFTREKRRPFDERTFLYGEEFLLAIDCLLSGHSTLYTSEVVVRHEESASVSLLPVRAKIAHGYDGTIDSLGLVLSRLEQRNAAAAGRCLQPDSPEIAAITGDGRKHVLIDLLFCQPGFHGGGEYGKAVFRAVVESAVIDGDLQVWAALDPSLFLDEWVLDCCRVYGVHVVAVKSFADIVSLVNSGRFDTFFAPAIVVYTGYEYMKKVGGSFQFTRSRTRVIGTLLDVRDLELAEDWERIAQSRKQVGCMREASFSTAAWQAEAACQARQAEALRGMYRGICASPALDELVTISDYTARSIRERIGTSRQIHTLYAPAKNRPEPQGFAWTGIDLAADPFGILLNADRAEKNAASIVAAFDRLFTDSSFAAAHPRLKLVLTGIAGLDDLQVAKPVHADRFVTMPHLAAPRLEWLLGRALFLAYPSFNEGFGYPPLEAMAHGTPSVISDNTAVPEVCGHAAVRCDPFDTDSIATAIRTVLSTPPSSHALCTQLATITVRQQRDMRFLADLICGRISSPGQHDDSYRPTTNMRAA